MSYGLKYLLTWESARGNDYKIEVFKKNYSGNSIVKKLGGAPSLVIDNSGSGICGTSLQFSIQADTDGELNELYTTDGKLFKVLLYRNSGVVWSGYLLQELYSEDYIAPPYDVAVTATDQLALLKDIPYTTSGRVSIFKVISNALAPTLLDIGYTVQCSLRPSVVESSYPFLDSVTVDDRGFAEMSCYEVLEGVLTTLNMRLQQINNTWGLIRENDISAMLHRYSSSLGHISSSSAVATMIGQMYENDVWPVGNLALTKQAAKKGAKFLFTPLLPLSILDNPSMLSDVAWEYNESFIEGKPGLQKPYGDETIQSLVAAYILNSTLEKEKTFALWQEKSVEASTDRLKMELSYLPIAYWNRGDVHATNLARAQSKLVVQISLTATDGTVYYLTQEGWLEEDKEDIIFTGRAVQDTISARANKEGYETVTVEFPGFPAAGDLRVAFRNDSRITADEFEGEFQAFLRMAVTNVFITLPSIEGYSSDVVVNDSAAQDAKQVDLLFADPFVVPNEQLLVYNTFEFSNSQTSTWELGGYNFDSFYKAIIQDYANSFGFVKNRFSGNISGANLINSIFLEKFSGSILRLESGVIDLKEDELNGEWLEVSSKSASVNAFEILTNEGQKVAVGSTGISKAPLGNISTSLDALINVVNTLNSIIGLDENDDAYIKLKKIKEEVEDENGELVEVEKEIPRNFYSFGEVSSGGVGSGNSGNGGSEGGSGSGGGGNYLTKELADTYYAPLGAFNTLSTNFNALNTKITDFFSNEEDVDTTINRWKELEKFLQGYTETSTLADLLAGKADKLGVDNLADQVALNMANIETLTNTINSIEPTVVSNVARIGVLETKVGENKLNIQANHEQILELIDNYHIVDSKFENLKTRIEVIESWFTLVDSDKDGVDDTLLCTQYNIASYGEVSSGGIGSGSSGDEGGSGVGNILPSTSLAAYGSTEKLTEVFSAYTTKLISDRVEVLEERNPINLSSMWGALASSGSEKIDSSHIPDLSGVYLPKTGGTISNSVYGKALTIHCSDSNYDAVIKFSNVSDGLLGYIGISGSATTQAPKTPYYSPNGDVLYPLIHTGNYLTTTDTRYLRLSGGKLTKDNFLVLSIENTATDLSVIGFYGKSGLLGHLGFNAVNKPRFMNTDGVGYDIIHSGNIGSYAFIPRADNLISNVDADHYWSNGAYLNQTGNGSGNSNFPNNYAMFLSFNNGASRYVTQFNMGRGAAYYRTKIDTWSKWHQFITDENIGSQSVNYAANAGNAEKVAGFPITSGTNKPWNSIPAITPGGYMDVGKQFEFHYDNTTNIDYSSRLRCTGNYKNIVDLPSTSGTLALLTDNVASATKLQTARTIWGQSFDGTGNVTGDLSFGSSSNKIYWYGDSNNYYIGYAFDMQNTSPNAKYVSYGGHRFIASTGEVLRISQNGYVGIGTSSPAYKLDVNGTGRFTGLATLSGGLSATTGSFSSTLSVSGKTTLNNVDINANYELVCNGSASFTTIKPISANTYDLGTDFFRWNNAYINTLDLSGNISVGGALSVAQATTLSGSLSVAKTTTLSGTLSVSQLASFHNVEIGSGYSLNCFGNGYFTYIYPQSNNTYNLGSSDFQWNNLFAQNINCATGELNISAAGVINFTNTEAVSTNTPTIYAPVITSFYLLAPDGNGGQIGMSNNRWHNVYSKYGDFENSIYIGSARVWWDSENDCLRVSKNFASDGEVSSGGVQSDSSDSDSSNAPILGGTISGDLDVTGKVTIGGLTTMNSGFLSKSIQVGSRNNDSIGFGNCSIDLYGAMYLNNPTTGKWASFTISDTSEMVVINRALSVVSLTQTSDIRFKQVIEDVCLSSKVIANAPMFRFTWVDGEDGKVHIGTSAQYWMNYAPELTTLVGSKYTLDYTTLGVLMGKSNATEIEQLKERVRILEQEVECYRRMLNAN